MRHVTADFRIARILCCELQQFHVFSKKVAQIRRVTRDRLRLEVAEWFALSGPGARCDPAALRVAKTEFLCYVLCRRLIRSSRRCLTAGRRDKPVQERRPQEPMMKNAPGLTGERSDHKVAGIFPDREAARRAAEELRDLLSLQASQLEVLHPGVEGVNRALEPEQAGIFHTILRSHAWLGLGGAVTGTVVFGLLYAFGLPLVVQSAWPAALVLAFFGAIAGMLLGGLVSLRPDHDPYISRVRAGLEAGASAVVVHAFDLAQRSRAEEELQARGGDTIRTL